MRHAVLLLLFLCACSSTPERREYRQSAFPMAPAFSPVEDAPHTVGQPGYSEPERLPRSPHTRELPQTAETRRMDGMWSGRAPKASGATSLFSIALPLSSDMPHEKAVVPAAMCASLLASAALGTRDALEAMDAMTTDRRRCAVARLYAVCISAVARELQNAKTKGYAYDADRYTAVLSAASTATTFVSSACTPNPFASGDAAVVDEIRSKFTTQWEALFNGTIR